MLQEDDGVSSRQVEPKTSNMSGQQHDSNGGICIEALHHLKTL